MGVGAPVGSAGGDDGSGTGGGSADAGGGRKSTGCATGSGGAALALGAASAGALDAGVGAGYCAVSDEDTGAGDGTLVYVGAALEEEKEEEGDATVVYATSVCVCTTVSNTVCVTTACRRSSACPPTGHSASSASPAYPYGRGSAYIGGGGAARAPARHVSAMHAARRTCARVWEVPRRAQPVGDRAVRCAIGISASGSAGRG